MKKIDDKRCEIHGIEPWSYHIIMYTHNRKNMLVGEIADRLVELFGALCTELKVSLRQIKIESDQVELRLGVENQMNMTKTLKAWQKSLSQALCKEFPSLKGTGTELWDSTYLISTIGRDAAEKNIRIEKILEALWAVEYYDIDESFTSYLDGSFEKDMAKFKAYLANRNLGIIEYGELVFLVDKEALAKEINLNCFECTKIYQYGCCCGSPCDMSAKNKKMFDKHSLRMQAEVKKIDEQQYDAIIANGGFINSEGVIKEFEGHCSLLIEHEGVSKCIAHKYALDYQIPIYDICPLSCLMYPLEIMELITNKQKTVILLTSVLEETFENEFGRWGSYKTLDVDLRCINKSAHNEIFREKDYKPVYEVNKHLLMHEFDDMIYKGIEKLFE